MKLPSTQLPEPVLPGVKGWRTSDGWQVLRLHYSADPERTTDEWISEIAQGYRGGLEGRDWQREMEISFDSYAGEPVYSSFDPDTSVKVTHYDPDLPLWRGWDFGYRHPAVVWLQYDPSIPQLRYLHEFYPTLDRESVPGMKIQDLAPKVIAITNDYFPEATTDAGSGIFDYADPAGQQHNDKSDYSSIEELAQHGIHAEWSVVGRKNRIAYARQFVEVPHRFRINPGCVLGIKAFATAYRYPTDRSGGQDRELPDLSRRVQEEPYIHLMDAFEYVVGNTLQVELDTIHHQTRGEDEMPDFGSLAEMYLGQARLKEVSGRQDFRDEMDDDLYDDLDLRLSDLVGDGSLADAWRVT